MKSYWPLLLIAVLLAAVVGMSQYADTSKQHYEESAREAKAAAVAKGDSGKAGDDTQESYKPPVWAKYVTWPEGVGAWAVILTIFVIAWQSVETKKAAKATEDAVTEAKSSRILADETSKRELRAYICLDSAEVIFDPWGQPIARVNFKNCGQTPAYEVHGWIAVDIAPHPLQGTFAPPPPHSIFRPKTTVGPQGKFGYPGQRKSPTFSQGDLDNMKSTSFAFYAYGRVEYKDTFGKEWHTNVRLIAGGKAGLRTSTESDGSHRWILGPDLEGNDAT